MSEQAGASRVTTPRFYRPELDILRFVAFLSVFLFHAVPSKIKVVKNYASIGALGVCLFFVLSSFLITELLRAEREGTGEINLSAFYLRRVLRIWPLYLAFILAATVTGIFVPSLHVDRMAIVSLLFIWGNWYSGWKDSLGVLLSPLWSISVEEQFYLLWPFLCKPRGRLPIVATSVLLMPVGAWAAFHLASHDAPKSSMIWNNSFVQFQMFAQGALLAILLNGRIPRFSNISRLLLIMGSLSLLAFGAYGGQLMEIGSTCPALLAAGYFAVGIGSSLLLLSVLGVRVGRYGRPLIYLGKISYGLYVFHVAALYLVNEVAGTARSLVGSALKLLAALVLTIAAASLSYRLLELPFVKMKERFAIIPSRTA